MKAQPTHTSSYSSRARVNTVYPLPAKRTASYNNVHHDSSSNGGPVRTCPLSPRSLAAASITKRRLSPSSRRTNSHNSNSSSAPTTYFSYRPAASQRHAAVTHQKALMAQQKASRTITRQSQISSLERGMRLLLEEEYREEVKSYMLEKEKKTMASASAMDQQPELQWHMRGHLLDFLIEIHLHFRLRPETLYLTLSILDRYVSRRIVYKKHYQLVGCVSLWLAAKFEDAKERVPSVKDLKDLCHGAYEEGAFVQMEGHVLGTVDWDLGHPTAEGWLRILCSETHLPSSYSSSTKLVGEDDVLFEEPRTQHVARFLMEASLYGRDYIQFTPSTLALGALCLARHICGKPRRTADESESVLHMITLLDHTLSNNLDAISQTLVKKYSYPFYFKASAVVVSFYLRGGRYPLTTSHPSPSSVPVSLQINQTSPTVSASSSMLSVKSQSQQQQYGQPTTPVRERMDVVSWGSGTSVDDTPGLIRSDSSSSCVGMDVEEEEMDVTARMDDDHRSTSAEDDDDEDDEEDEYHRRYYAHNGQTLSIPSSDDIACQGSSVNSEPSLLSASSEGSLPITPTTPMFQLDPFGSHAPSHRDKENVVPKVPKVSQIVEQDSVVAQQQEPCHPVVVPGSGVVGAVVVDEDYRQALLAIVP